MMSKRFALRLAIGGIAAATWCGLGPVATSVAAQEMGAYVPQAMYQQGQQDSAQIARIGFLDGNSDCDTNSQCDAAPVYETDGGCDGAGGCDGGCGGACGSSGGLLGGGSHRRSGLGGGVLGGVLGGGPLGGGLCGNRSACGGGQSCESDDCDCGSGGFLVNGWSCDLGEPFSLFGSANGISVGGWSQFGYHSKALPLFNSRPDDFQLHQMWLYAEKAIDTSNGFDIGGRVDYVYGTDGPDTQAFGIDNDHWDNDWDNGGDYGHALPQAYFEAGYGDLSVKIGHFFTLIGFEVVAAPDNFFYSHAYTMYNSEPFTHTGALFTYNVSDDLTTYAGYTMGWDSGFEDNGDSFLGGASLNVSDNVNVTYATTGGRFNRVFPNGVDSDERGYMHSIVTDVTVTDKIQYIAQTDMLRTKDANGNVLRDTRGLNNYLIYTISDCFAVGSRLEWYDASGVFDEANIYALTLGANIKPHANVLIRPEIRWDHVDEDNIAVLEDNDDDQTTFGIDTIFLF